MLEAVYIKALATAGSFAAAFVMACIISRAIKRENTSLFVKRFDHGRSLVERLLLSFFVVGLFYTGATKPNLGGGSNRGAFCACSTPRSLFSQSGNELGVADLFSTYTNVVTNLCFIGIHQDATSVWLGVAWPISFPISESSIDIFALEDLSRNAETNAWSCIGRAAVNESVGRTQIQVLPESLTGLSQGSLFFQIGTCDDTDEDGKTDAYEKLVAKTNPNMSDTDNDGYFDGWEIDNGLNPLNSDTDNDGLEEWSEIGGELTVCESSQFVRGGSLTNFTATSILMNASQTNCLEVGLPTSYTVAGSIYNRIAIDPNGIVYLCPTGSENKINVAQFPDDYAEVLGHVNECILMPYWSRLTFSPNEPASEVSVATTNGHLVVTYANMRFDPSGVMDQVPSYLRAFVPMLVEATPLSFQLELDPVSGRCVFRYDFGRQQNGMLDDLVSGLLAAVGMQSRFAGSAEDFSFAEAGALSSGMGIEFSISTGTNPATFDTDGDGMGDGEELLVGRNPKDETDREDHEAASLFLFFGDPSRTHSESYRVQIVPVADSGRGECPDAQEFISAQGGLVRTSVCLKKGWKYSITMEHVSSSLDAPDYDYVLSFSSMADNIFIEDPDGLRACHIYENLTTDFPADGKIAFVSVADFGLKIRSIAIKDYDQITDGVLIDSRRATVEVDIVPSTIPASAFDFAIDSAPEESGTLVNDNHGTDIAFTPAEPAKWTTSKIYWYGSPPDRECYYFSNAYIFRLKIGSKIICQKRCPVRWPEKLAEAVWAPPCANETTFGAVRHWGGEQEGFYYVEIDFKPFAKMDGIMLSTPCEYGTTFSWSGQYLENIVDEEEFHLKQFKGEVSAGEGGNGDCYTIDGLKYFLAQQAKNDKRISTATWIIKGATPNEVKRLASRVIRKAIDRELEVSSLVLEASRGFSELKAKERANYNAAYRYHCTYLTDYGPNPQPAAHPRLRQGGTNE